MTASVELAFDIAESVRGAGGKGPARKWIYNHFMAEMGSLEFSLEWGLCCHHNIGSGQVSLSLGKGGPLSMWCHQPSPGRQELCTPHESARITHGPSPIPCHPRKRTLKSTRMSWSWNLLSRSSCRDTGFTSGRTKRRNFRPGTLHLRSLKKALEHPNSKQ